ncbi:ROK family protein [Pullulanibacillus sp. KACC 23026]|uniref:ROK family protein n=1 Tax=Pullulanibacillus sp. KACC 23026 TaxID=3028315 RepID=UPI0023AE7FE7|nr:ROK family protein [Pullulanibacillus sp. KACC 23026]WEG10775.1 ROK family protein [Pullulanibacillus sp. KACC 23026]
MEEKIIGVDIGGTNIRVGFMTRNLQLVKKETASTSRFKNKEEFFQYLRQMIERVDVNREAKKIGMAFPVPWNEGIKTLYDSTNLTLLENMSVNEMRSYFAEYDLYLENDVNVIALLESDFGAAKNSRNSIYITVSTGIGGGLIVNNSIYRGTHGYAGEVGSMIISNENKNHFSLYSGTLESLCSGKALEDESQKLYGKNATTKLLFENYKKGTADAIKVVEVWVDYFSSAIASLMQVLDPEVFVLGGSVILNNQWLVEKLIEGTKRKVFKQLIDKVRIVISEYGHDAGIIGAGYITIKN